MAFTLSRHTQVVADYKKRKYNVFIVAHCAQTHTHTRRRHHIHRLFASVWQVYKLRIGVFCMRLITIVLRCCTRKNEREWKHVRQSQYIRCRMRSARKQTKKREKRSSHASSVKSTQMNRYYKRCVVHRIHRNIVYRPTIWFITHAPQRHTFSFCFLFFLFFVRVIRKSDFVVERNQVIFR